MAFRRRFMRRRGFRRRRGYASKFMRKHRQGGPGPRPELKYVDHLNGTAVTPSGIASPTISVLNLTQEGAGPHNRIGRRIQLRSVELNILPNDTTDVATIAGQVYRLLLVYDSQWNGASSLTTSDLLQATDEAGTSSTNVMSPINMNNRDRYLVLRDWMWNSLSEVSSASGAFATGANVGSAVGPRLPRRLHWYIKLKGLETVYKASTATAADISTGALLLIALIGNQHPAWNFVCSSRVRFYD